MRIIIGLGNPGKEYERTRHNTGFLFLDMLKEKWEFPEFADEKKFSALITSAVRDNEKILLVKPSTFMNRSGETVAALLHFYKLSSAEIVVIHDDLDLPFGAWKDASGSGPAGHNGVTDIIKKLNTKDFRRIRIGIGRPPENVPAENYVLEHFTTEEEQKLKEIFEEISKSI